MFSFEVGDSDYIWKLILLIHTHTCIVIISPLQIISQISHSPSSQWHAEQFIKNSLPWILPIFPQYFFEEYTGSNQRFCNNRPVIPFIVRSLNEELSFYNVNLSDVSFIVRDWTKYHCTCHWLHSIQSTIILYNCIPLPSAAAFQSLLIRVFLNDVLLHSTTRYIRYRDLAMLNLQFIKSMILSFF